MAKRICAALFLLLVSGGFYFIGAQETHSYKPAPSYKNYKPAPAYTDQNIWYGFVSDSADVKLGYKATPEMIKKSVANGAYYVLYSVMFGRVALDSPAKAEPYAGKWVWVKGTITSSEYGTGPTVSADIEAVGYSNFAPSKAAVARPSRTIKIISMTETEHTSEY